MKGSTIFAFAIGAAVGSVVTWKLVKTKYEQIAQEEINSVKEMYAAKAEHDEPDDMDEVEKQLVEFELQELNRQEYREIVKDYMEGGSEPLEIGTPPYVISYEEFNEVDDYETMCLNYYSDGILADDWGEIVEDVDNVVGKDFADHFGENEDEPDVVYVRNDRLKCDYEICRDSRKYSERPSSTGLN